MANWLAPNGNPYLIAGPCSAETQQQVEQTFSSIAKLGVHALRVGIWKPRTRPGGFEGVGEKGLSWVKTAAQSVSLPVMVEVAKPAHIESCLKAGIDMLWIGARTTVNPIMVQDLADVLKGVDIPVFVKNPINPDLDLWIGALERFERADIKHLAAIHRGFSTSEESDFRNNPQWQLPVELRCRNKDIPIICDPSHIAGKAALVPKISQQALNLGFDGLMIEAHQNPATALSDAAQQLSPSQLAALLNNLVIRNVSIETMEDNNRILGIRDEIDAVDRDIVSLLAKRDRLVMEMGNIKENHNIPLLQPQRWKEIVENKIQLCREQGMDEKYIVNLWHIIHHHSIDIQTDNYNPKNNL